MNAQEAAEIKSIAYRLIALAAADVKPVPQDFDEAYYLNNNPDVAAAVNSGSWPTGYAHYLAWGKIEGRLPKAPTQPPPMVPVPLPVPDNPQPVVSGGDAVAIAKAFRFRSDGGRGDKWNVIRKEYGTSEAYSLLLSWLWNDLGSAFREQVADAGMDRVDVGRLVNYFSTGQRGTGFESLGPPVIKYSWGTGLPPGF